MSRGVAHMDQRDANEPGIVEALREAGAVVHRLSAPGVPDLLVGYRGLTHLLEVKTMTGGLTPAQVTFIDEWHGSPVHIVMTPHMALRAIGAV